MDVVAAPEVVAAVQEAGGRLYVWPVSSRCCGKCSTRLEAGAQPKDGVCFDVVPAPGFELFFARMATLPNELHLDVHGRGGRRRVAAYWDNCAWIT